MIILDLFPGGVIQLWDSIANGYWHARRLTFLMGGTYHKLEWLRMVGDVVFLLAGALPSRSACCAVCGKGISLPRRKGCTPPDPANSVWWKVRTTARLPLLDHTSVTCVTDAPDLQLTIIASIIANHLQIEKCPYLHQLEHRSCDFSRWCFC